MSDGSLGYDVRGLSDAYAVDIPFNATLTVDAACWRDVFTDQPHGTCSWIGFTAEWLSKEFRIELFPFAFAWGDALNEVVSLVNGSLPDVPDVPDVPNVPNVPNVPVSAPAHATGDADHLDGQPLRVSGVLVVALAVAVAALSAAAGCACALKRQEDEADATPEVAEAAEVAEVVSGGGTRA